MDHRSRAAPPPSFDWSNVFFDHATRDSPTSSPPTKYLRHSAAPAGERLDATDRPTPTCSDAHARDRRALTLPRAHLQHHSIPAAMVATTTTTAATTPSSFSSFAGSGSEGTPTSPATVSGGQQALQRPASGASAALNALRDALILCRDCLPCAAPHAPSYEQCCVEPCHVAGPTALPDTDQTCEECRTLPSAAVSACPPSFWGAPAAETSSTRTDRTSCDVDGCEISAASCCFETHLADTTPAAESVLVCANDDCLNGGSFCTDYECGTRCDESARAETPCQSGPNNLASCPDVCGDDDHVVQPPHVLLRRHLQQLQNTSAPTWFGHAASIDDFARTNVAQTYATPLSADLSAIARSTSSYQHWCLNEHTCQWLGCGLRCDSVEALAHHVNSVHLHPQQRQQVSPFGHHPSSSMPVSQPTQLVAYSDGVQDANQSASLTSAAAEAAAFQCLWNSCSLDATFIDDSDSILRHILSAHVVPECATLHSHSHGSYAKRTCGAKSSNSSGNEHDAEHKSAAIKKRKADATWDMGRPVDRDAMRADRTWEEAKSAVDGGFSRASAKPSVASPTEEGTDASIECGCSKEHDGGALSVHPCRWEGCQRAFTTHSGLTEHIARDHVGSGKAQYECKWGGCGRADRVFTQKQKVLRHLQTHTGDRPFQCSVCHKRFSEANTLAQHKRTHTREKPFVCDFPDCKKAFAVAGSLTIHKRTHTGDKPFKCKWPGCERAFSESSNLTKHVRTHTGERPFLCPSAGCGKSFSRPDQLARHRKIHGNEIND